MTRRAAIRIHTPGVAETTSGQSRDFGEIASWDKAVYWLTVTAMAGAGGTFDCQIQEKDPHSDSEYTDGSTNHPAAIAIFTQVTQAGPFPWIQRIVVNPSLGRRIRAKWTLAGGATSVTFGLTAVVGSEEG